MWGGNPIKCIRFTKDQEAFVTTKYAEENMKMAQDYKYQFIPQNNAYLYKPTDPEDEKINYYHNLKENF